MNIIKERYNIYNLIKKDDKLSKEMIDLILNNINELGIVDEVSTDLEETPQFIETKIDMIMYEFIFYLLSLDINFNKNIKKDFKHIIKSNTKWIETEASKYIYNPNRLKFNIKEDLQQMYFIVIEYLNYYNISNLLKSHLDNIDYQQSIFQATNNYIYHVLINKFNVTIAKIQDNPDKYSCNIVDLVIFANTYFPTEYKKIKKILVY